VAPSAATPRIRIALMISGATIAFQVGGRAFRERCSSRPFTLPTCRAWSQRPRPSRCCRLSSRPRRWADGGPDDSSPVSSRRARRCCCLSSRCSDGPRLIAVLLSPFQRAGRLLVSGFWSLINERFDPRTAKRAVGQIGGAGTLAAWPRTPRGDRRRDAPRTAAAAGARAAPRQLRVARAVDGCDDHPCPAERSTVAGPLRVVAASPYLRTIAVVVLLATVSEGLLDYVLKVAATDIYGTETRCSESSRSSIPGRACSVSPSAPCSGASPWRSWAGADRGSAALYRSHRGRRRDRISGPRHGTGRQGLGIRGAELTVPFGYELLFTALPESEKRAPRPCSTSARSGSATCSPRHWYASRSWRRQ